jgi:hypothetical protein
MSKLIKKLRRDRLGRFARLIPRGKSVRARAQEKKPPKKESSPRRRDRDLKTRSKGAGAVRSVGRGSGPTKKSQEPRDKKRKLAGAGSKKPVARPVPKKKPTTRETKKRPRTASPKAAKPTRRKPARKPETRKPVRKSGGKKVGTTPKKPVRGAKPTRAGKPVGGKKIPTRRPPKKRKKLPERGPGGRFVKKGPPKAPTVPERSALAEVEIQTRLLALQEALARLESELRMGVATFVNPDGTVDGELRIANLPSDWREPGGGKAIAAFLSSAFREWRAFDKQPVMGGSFWISFTIRFGGMSEEEVEALVKLYKRHRGQWQITTYPLQAWLPGAIQMALVSDVGGIKGMVTSLMDKRGYPPSAIHVRVIWMTTNERPGHFKGE